MPKTTDTIDNTLLKKARELTGLKTNREVVRAALELPVRSESRKGMLRYFGSGIWSGNLRRMRRNRH